jgi:hypothetical protein
MKNKSNYIFALAFLVAAISYIPLFEYMKINGNNFIPMVKDQFSTPGLVFLGYDLLITVIIYIIIIINLKYFNKKEKIILLLAIALSGIAFSITLALGLALRKQEKNN